MSRAVHTTLTCDICGVTETRQHPGDDHPMLSLTLFDIRDITVSVHRDSYLRSRPLVELDGCQSCHAKLASEVEQLVQHRLNHGFDGDNPSRKANHATETEGQKGHPAEPESHEQEQEPTCEGDSHLYAHAWPADQEGYTTGN